MADDTNLITSLLAVQKEVQKIGLKPEGTNPHYNSTFVTLEQILKAVLPVLNKHGIVLTQRVTHLDGQPALTTSLIGSPTEIYEDTMLLLLKSNDPQAQGSAITYARRYSLMALLGLVGGDDDDGQRATAVYRDADKLVDARPVETDRLASPKQKNLMIKLLVEKGVPKLEDQLHIIASIAGIDDAKDLTLAQAKRVIDELFNTPKEALIEYLEYDNIVLEKIGDEE